MSPMGRKRHRYNKVFSASDLIEKDLADKMVKLRIDRSYPLLGRAKAHA